MFIHHLSKFGKFSLKIGGEIIFQSWPLFNLFSQLTHCALSDRVEIFLRCRWSPPQKNIKQFLCHRSYSLSKRNLKFTNTFSLFLSCVKYLMLFDVFKSSPHRVAKCHRYGRLICVNFLEIWGKILECNIRASDVG